MKLTRIITLGCLVSVFFTYALNLEAKPKSKKKKKQKQTTSFVTEDSSYTENSSTGVVLNSIEPRYLSLAKNFSISAGYRGDFTYEKKNRAVAFDPNQLANMVNQVGNNDNGDGIDENVPEIDWQEILNKYALRNLQSSGGFYLDGDQNEDNDKRHVVSNLYYRADLLYSLDESSFLLSWGVDGLFYASYSTEKVVLSFGNKKINNQGWRAKTPIELNLSGDLPGSTTMLEINFLKDFSTQIYQAAGTDEFGFSQEWYATTFSDFIVPLVQFSFDLDFNITLLGGAWFKISEGTSLKTDASLTIYDEPEAKLFRLTADLDLRLGSKISSSFYLEAQKFSEVDDIILTAIPSIKYMGLTSLFVPYFSFIFEKFEKSDWSLALGVLGTL